MPTRRDVLAGAAVALASTKASAVTHPMLERSSRPINEESLPETFAQRITPIDSFYVRNHFDMPNVDVKTFSLTIEGLVDKNVTLSLPELAALPQVTIEAVLQCAGNGRGRFVPHVPGVQWDKGACGNARWTGPRLRDVLAAAKPKSGARFVELQGKERPVNLVTPSFIRAIPVEKALHEDTIIALLMNDEPLPSVHGFPARLVAPGWVGDDWVKWLTRVALVDKEPDGFYYAKAYRAPVEGGATVPMTELTVKSILALPASGATLTAGPVKIRGVAFSSVAIAKVEVSVDAGMSWSEAKLVDKGGAYGFTVFEHAFEAHEGKLRVMSRATDAHGRVQPSDALWNPGGYLYNAVDVVDVEVTP